MVLGDIDTLHNIRTSEIKTTSITGNIELTILTLPALLTILTKHRVEVCSDCTVLELRFALFPPTVCSSLGPAYLGNLNSACGAHSPCALTINHHGEFDASMRLHCVFSQSPLPFPLTPMSDLQYSETPSAPVDPYSDAYNAPPPPGAPADPRDRDAAPSRGRSRSRSPTRGGRSPHASSYGRKKSPPPAKPKHAPNVRYFSLPFTSGA